MLCADSSSLTARDMQGDTPLHVAALFGHLEVLVLLIAFGSEIDAKDDCLRTPLLLASANGHDRICEELLKAGADVNARDLHGRTCVHWAFLGSQYNCARRLLDAGVRIDIVDSDSKLLLDVAKDANAVAILSQLLQETGRYSELHQTSRGIKSCILSLTPKVRSSIDVMHVEVFGACISRCAAIRHHSLRNHVLFTALCDSYRTGSLHFTRLLGQIFNTRCLAAWRRNHQYIFYLP